MNYTLNLTGEEVALIREKMRTTRKGEWVDIAKSVYEKTKAFGNRLYKDKNSPCPPPPKQYEQVDWMECLARLLDRHSQRELSLRLNIKDSRMDALVNNPNVIPTQREKDFIIKYWAYRFEKKVSEAPKIIKLKDM